MSPAAAPDASPDTIDLTDATDDVERLRLVLVRLSRRIRASSHENITASQRSALGTIGLLGPVSIGQIAEHEHVQPPAVSKIVATLEQRQLVERTDDPNDRRCSLISLSPAGRDLLDEMRAAARGFISAHLSQLDPDDVAALERALPALERLLGTET